MDVVVCYEAINCLLDERKQVRRMITVARCSGKAVNTCMHLVCLIINAEELLIQFKASACSYRPRNAQESALVEHSTQSQLSQLLVLCH